MIHMAPTLSKKYRSAPPRTRRTPPRASLKDIRLAVGITIDQLIERMEEISGRRYTRGAVSAVENGLRGASQELLGVLAMALGMPADAFETDYEPKSRASAEVA